MATSTLAAIVENSENFSYFHHSLKFFPKVECQNSDDAPSSQLYYCHGGQWKLAHIPRQVFTEYDKIWKYWELVDNQ
jgi:hypothetical protein